MGDALCPLGHAQRPIAEKRESQRMTRPKMLQ